MINFDKIFKSYSVVMNSEMDRYIEQIGQNGKEPQENDIEDTLNNILEKWLDTPLADADGVSPGEIIKKLGTLEEAVDAFKSFMIIGEGIIPDVLKSKLEEYGSAAVDELLNILTHKDSDPCTENESDSLDFHPYFYVKQGIINLMGLWKEERSIPSLVEVIRNSNDKDEFLADAAVNAVVKIGAPVVSVLIEEAKSATDEKLINFMDALTLIGNESNDIRIFPVIKDYFLNSENRDMALALFVQLNDPKAIPFLRGYIEKNAENIAYQEYSSLKNCIEELGGNVEDIRISFDNDPEYQKYIKAMNKYGDTNDDKTGRNDPCPCGSGKKYKKCCGK